MAGFLLAFAAAAVHGRAHVRAAASAPPAPVATAAGELPAIWRGLRADVTTALVVLSCLALLQSLDVLILGRRGAAGVR